MATGAGAKVITTTPVAGTPYKIRCISDSHFDSGFLADDRTTLQGRSSEGTFFVLEATDTEGQYYLKSQITGKYINANNITQTGGNVTFDAEHTTYWTLDQTNANTERHTWAIRPNGTAGVSLNNNGDASAACPYMKIFTHDSPTRYCDLWIFDDGAPDYTTGQEGITTTHGSRKTSQLVISDNRESASVTITDLQSAASGQPVYFDKTASVFTTKVGATVTVTPTADGSFMQNMVYVDWDNDGFAYTGISDYIDTDAHSRKAGVDLVYVGIFKVGNSWYDNEGASYGNGNKPLNNPCTFVVPNVPEGTYRVRYKVDWDNLDPKGTQGDGSTNNSVASNGGIIVDFLMTVTAADGTLATAEDIADAKNLIAALYAPFVDANVIDQAGSAIDGTVLAEDLPDAVDNAVNSILIPEVRDQVVTIVNVRREAMGQAKYMTVNPVTKKINTSETITEYGKWLLRRVSDSSEYFRVYNPETQSYVCASNNSIVTTDVNDACQIKLVENTDGTYPGTAMRFLNSDNGFNVDTSGNDLCSFGYNDGGSSWSFNRVSSSLADLDLTGQTYYRIRSARGQSKNDNQLGLLGINTVVENGAAIADNHEVICRQDGLGVLWTLHSADDGKVIIRNAAADYEGNDACYGITGTNPDATSHSGNNNTLVSATPTPVTILTAKGAKNSVFTHTERGLAIATLVRTGNDSNLYMDHNSTKPIFSGWNQVNNDFPNNGGIYYFELAEDADEVIAAYKSQAMANNAAVRANNNVDYVLTLAPNVPALYDGVDTEALSAVKVAAPDIADVKTANAAATAEVDGLDALNAALAKVDEVLASRWFAVRNVRSTDHLLSLTTTNGTSKPQYQVSAEGTTVNTLNHIWKLVPAGNNTYKLYNYGIHKNLGHKNVRNTALEFEDVDAGSAYTMERGPLWDKVNSVAFRMPESTPQGDNLLFDDKDNSRMVSWSALAAGNTGAQWVIELIDFEPAKSVAVSGYKHETEGWKLTFTGEGLVKTEGLGAHHSLVYGNTPAKEENAVETYALDGETTVAPDASNITVDGGVATLTLIDAEDGNYTINVPAGFFTVNNKLSEPFSADVTLKDGVVTSISEVMPAADVEAEYFDLNGRKVLNPAGGIFIVRKGDKVIKQIIR
jgi:glycosyl hydrolase family 85